MNNLGHASIALSIMNIHTIIADGTDESVEDEDAILDHLCNYFNEITKEDRSEIQSWLDNSRPLKVIL